MHPALLVPLIACVLAAATASAIVSHDPTQRANWLVAGTLACSAWWSLCEVLWNVQQDPEVVVWMVRLSSLGWLWLGPLSLDLFTELASDSRSALRRWVPAAYAAGAASILLYVATPWCIEGAVKTGFGWGYVFGPLFPLVYGFTMACVATVILRWLGAFSDVPPRERRQARLLLAGFALPMGVASVTDVVLPYAGVHVPRLGSASLLAMGCAVAWSLQRHGYLLLAPGAFAVEILAALRDGVALLHPDGSVRTCNEHLGRLAGATPAALQGRPLESLLPGFRPGSGEARVREVFLQPAEGEPVPVSVSSSALRDEGGHRIGEVLAIHDLRDVAALRGRLVTSGRLAAVGELAAGIAHEIANPVSFVRANLVQLRRHWQILEEASRKLGDGPHELLGEGEELIEEVLEGVDRVAGIVRDVGAFSHAGRGRAERVDLNELLESAVGVAVLSFSVVVERCYSDLPRVACDPQQLKQVFLNLLLNALQAVGDSGHIRLVTQARGGWVSVRVEDDGPGIASEHLERVFDPFFTTRPAERVGLGLAHAHEIVVAHGGDIRATSEPGLGATFEVRLPLHQE